MSPLWMTLCLLVGFGVFAYSAVRRWRLMMVARAPLDRSDQIGRRVGATIRYAIGQARMPRYPAAGIAHILVFFGFLVLLLNTLILWGRGYVPDFHFGVFSPEYGIGRFYALLRDLFTVLVIVGVLIFAYYRGIARPRRLTFSGEAWLILAIIFVMMIADLLYEGGEIVRQTRAAGDAPPILGYAPFASLTARAMAGWSEGAVRFAWQAGFWTHSLLVLLFLNILPYGKHFHVITVLPNVFAQNLDGIGRVRTIADIEGRLEREETLGVRTVEDLSWKDVLDLYTCTECGRCTDQCPANRTGKRLSPKHLTTAVRDHMYANAAELIRRSRQAPGSDGDAEATPLKEDERFALVREELVHPETIWACTTCGACEQECPVFISYVDKIVALRQHMVMEQGDFPDQLQNAFKGMETVGNVYSFANEQRADWAKGLDVPIMAEKQEAEYLYWVGCAPSFDDRSRKVAVAFAKLLIEAGVDFAILGPEEMCTGDAARRAGNEYLFQMYAQQNCETMNQYKFRHIVTTCPHCYNTLKNEYGDFGGRYDVIHHTELLARLVRERRLVPQHPVSGTVAYHDSCYLGRYNHVYDPPREILRAIPGLRVVEPAERRDRGMCCGAGGAQMWKEEEPGDQKVNHARTEQLLRVLPARDASCTVATACPFCMTMLTDGLRDKDFDEIGQLDVAELLARSVLGEQRKAADQSPEAVSQA